MYFTENFGAINLLVVFGATVASNILSGLWYAPFAFGKIWQRGMNIPTPTNMANAPATFITAFILQLVAASMIAAMLGPNAGGSDGLQLGMIVAVAFVLTSMGATNLFEKRPFSVIAVNISFHIASFSLMGFIIGTWG